MAQPRWKHPIKTDNTLVRKRVRSGANVHKTMSFSGTGIGSDYDMVMTYRVSLKKARKPTLTKLRFDLEKPRNPNVAFTFGGKLQSSV